MHELGYCEGIVEAVERRAVGRPVARVGVRVGALHRFHADAFEQSFQLAAMGGVADGAATELVVVPTSASCRSCANDFESTDPTPACPSCGSLDLDVSGGDELVLEWVEYRESATTATPLAPLARAEGS